MLRNYFKIALRNLIRNKVYSFINIGGLAVGMAVAILIGLWVWDEVSFDTSFEHYDRIAQVMQHQTYNGDIGTQVAVPFPLGAELRLNYGRNFKHVLMASWSGDHALTVGDQVFTKRGIYIESAAPEVFTLNMLRGTRAGLTEPASIMLSQSTAQALFGSADPLHKVIKLDTKTPVTVTGVYEDLPRNSSISDWAFLVPWDLLVAQDKWFRENENPWRCNCFQAYVQIADEADFEKVSAQIKDVKVKNIHEEELRYKPEVFLHPMRQWHLYSEFKNGIRTGGLIELVWLFGLIGVFVLLLACINFMNLSTARSEKRAKEVGIRKAIGSVRRQLISQFLGESLLVTSFAFIVALGLVQSTLPAFNQLASKQIAIPWTNPAFWLLGLGITLLTGLIAGSYPALYLSAFNPVKVLKGTFRVGRFAALPRRVLVVAQFTVSVALIIGTIIVFRQIEFAKNRPVGYSRAGLVMVNGSEKVHQHLDAIRNGLQGAGVAAELAESTGPVTYVWSTNGGFEWRGKDPNQSVDFPNTGVSYEYGKAIGWEIVAGRDFSRAFGTDSSSFIVNEAAVKYMGLKNPIGEIIRWDKKPFTIIGVVKNIVAESPYQITRPSIYHLDMEARNFVMIRLNPAISTTQAIATIESTFKKQNPAIPFNYQFVDQEYAKKFGDEERIGKLASVFALLAILISCLGLFGLASFVAEARTKEIGVRKVLGASVLNVWGLLSKDFLVLVIIAFAIATPIAYSFLHHWLQQYEYRTQLSWWIFAASGGGALLITLLTVSFQSIKAALANPVKSLRNE